MLTFSQTRTRRVCVTLKELTLGQAIGICKLSPERYELGHTELLRQIAADATQPVPKFVTDPRLWTIEERMLLVTTYLSRVAMDGPDFSVGTRALSDFVDFNLDLKQEETDLGVVADKERVMRPLLGIHAQALELLCSSRGDWIRGAMACQVFEKDTAPAADFWAGMSDMDVMAWVKERMDAILELPDGDVEALSLAWDHGRQVLAHFFVYTFDSEGIVAVELEPEGGGASATARFPADSCVTSTAKNLAG